MEYRLKNKKIKKSDENIFLRHPPPPPERARLALHGREFVFPQQQALLLVYVLSPSLTICIRA